MKSFFNKPFRWAITYSIVLIGFTAYTLLYTFVIPHGVIALDGSSSQSSQTTDSSNQALNKSNTTTASSPQSKTTSSADTSKTVTENSYSDSNISITITTERIDNTTVYLADIQISNIDYLKTAFANNTFGRNIKAATSTMAEDNNAIFAINGDYYGFRDAGYVVRNGTLYRSTAQSDTTKEDLAIMSDGSFQIVTESKTSAQSLVDSGALQVLSFGPSLLLNGKLSVDKNTEVDQSMASNPRTAIGIITPLHYLIVVSDGRTSVSAGLSLYELAQVMSDNGCTTAYNLDGGGSSTMWFNGKVVNNPTDGHSSGERKVSDIVYIGY